MADEKRRLTKTAQLLAALIHPPPEGDPRRSRRPTNRRQPMLDGANVHTAGQRVTGREAALTSLKQDSWQATLASPHSSPDEIDRHRWTAHWLRLQHTPSSSHHRASGHL